MKMDKMDKIHRRVCLTWHRTSGQPGILSLEKEYVLIPIASNRGTINIFPWNKMLSVIDKSEARAVSSFQTYEGVHG